METLGFFNIKQCYINNSIYNNYNKICFKGDGGILTKLEHINKEKYSYTHKKDAEYLSLFIKDLVNNDIENTLIIDGTSSLGGNLISFIHHFKFIIGIEINQIRFNKLMCNLNNKFFLKFIKQKNFFKKENLTIKRISINDANFSIQKSDFNFFDNLINNDLSHKKVLIKKGNIFYKDDENQIVSLIKIKKLLFFYDDIKLLNIFNLKGEIFNLPFTLKLTKEISKEANQIINIKSKKIKLNFLNESKRITDKMLEGSNVLKIFNSNFGSVFNYQKNLLEFSSTKLKSSNPTIKYSGKLSLKPFELILDLDLEDLKIKRIFDPNSIYMEILKNNFLFNKNLSAKISVNSIEKNNRKLDYIKMILNINNGNINFNKSSLKVKNIGEIEIVNSTLILENDELIFNTDINIDIEDTRKFFSFLQTPKNSRMPIKNIKINLDYNLYNDQIVLNNIKFDNLEPNKDSQDLISIFNTQENNEYKNFIKNKHLFNKILDTYSG